MAKHVEAISGARVLWAALERLIGRVAVPFIERPVAVTADPHALRPGRRCIRPVKMVESEPGQFNNWVSTTFPRT